jgi:NurA-like 5'-3' nuclease
MIINKSNSKLDEIRNFAKENNMLESFNEIFSRLENYSDKGYIVTLYSDFVPLFLESCNT